MAKIIVDGVEYEVDSDNNLLQECLSHGLDLPYFCWHPCMGSVGACRQCAVKQYKDADDEKGMLVMSCMTPATDGAIISIKDQQAVQMRERVIESLMTNHPHDCPVCEEGGECHLQDMTLMSGHNYRRYDKKKRTHRNQYLGPFISHEMNRCIACYRCVRYYDDYAGGTDLAAMASHNHVYFGRHQEGTLESEFSGNLVEVCPTGVFTDKVFSQRYSRKWDLQAAPSVCTGCAVGCNTTPGERYGELRRVVNRYNSEVNGYFLCDRGRFGFGYVNSAERLKVPVRQGDGQQEELDANEAHQLVQRLDGKIIGIGSPRASNESNFALRNLVGDDNFYAGVSAKQHAANQLILELHRDAAFHVPSVREIESCDAVLVLGEDVTNVAPRIALALRQSVRNKAKELAESANIPQWQDAAVRELAQEDRSPLAIFSNYASRLDDVASDTVVAGNQKLVKLGSAIAAELAGESASAGLDEAERELIGRVAQQLSSARRPLIVAGSSARSMELIKVGANIARALGKRSGNVIDFALLLPEVNSLGLSLLVQKDKDLSAALGVMESGAAKHCIVLENDLYRRAATSEVDAAIAGVDSLIVIDQLATPTSAKADIVLPATAFSEHEATYVNYEGRAQLSYQVHRNHSAARPAWRWLCENPAQQVEELVDRCAESVSAFKGIASLLPDLNSMIAGMRVPRQSHRYSGRTAMKAHVNVHEPKQAVDSDSVMSFSMEGIPASKDATVLGASWAPGWNSNQSISKFQDEINGKLKQEHCGELLLKDKQASGDFFNVTADQSDANNGLEVLPAYQIFGSDELSAHAPAIRERMTDAYLSLSPQDAEQLGLKHGQGAGIAGTDYVAIVCIREKIQPGTVAVYCGTEINPHDLPERIVLNANADIAERGIRGLIVSDLLEESY